MVAYDPRAARIALLRGGLVAALLSLFSYSVGAGLLNPPTVADEVHILPVVALTGLAAAVRSYRKLYVP